MTRWFFIVLCVFLYFLNLDASEVGYGIGQPIYNHLSYIFFHANLFHLIINMTAFYFLFGSVNNKTVTFLASIIIGATLISFGSVDQLPTIGASGLIFILVGIQASKLVYNRQVAFIPFFTFTILSLVSGFLIPHVNGLVHLLGFALGYISHIIFETVNDSIRDKRRES